MNLRLATAAAIAVLLASLSMSAVIADDGWVATGAGAILIVAIAGILSRLPRLVSAAAATVLVLIAVVPLLTRPTWADRIAGLLIVLVTALSATGVRPLRGFAVLATYVAGLLLYLNVAFAHNVEFGHIIPSLASLSELGQLWRAAFASFAYAPPVPDIPGVSLVTAAGIGAVAIAVDILAVRLRRPAIAGLPLLLLFSVPVASNLKVFGIPQMVIFAAGLAGYLALLSADGRDRLRMWGRLVTFRHVQSADETGSGPDTRELAASGRRIGLAAVCLAVVIPVVLPTMHTHDVFSTTPDGSGGGHGSSGVSPLLGVGRQLVEKKPVTLFTYTTTPTDPPDRYLQVYVLNYNTRQNKWLELPFTDARGSTGSKLPWTPPGVLGSTPVHTVTTKISLSKGTRETVLPVPYAPTQLKIRGESSGLLEAPGSLMVDNTGLSMPGLQYTVKSNELDPSPNNISGQSLPYPTSITNEYLSYSGPDKTKLQGIAERHTEAAGAVTELQYANDLEKWFADSGTFKYSLNPDLPATNWLYTFLTSERRGFCSQFAQAFAILARLLGFPSRIVVGYTGGYAGPGNTWTVTTADAHAWPEIYFPGEGWLRFEPTPSGLHGQGTAEAPAYANATSSRVSPAQLGSSQNTPVNSKDTAAQRLKNHNLNRFPDEPAAGEGATSQATSSGLGLAIGIPLALFLLIAWPALVRLLTRRRRWLMAAGDAGLAHSAWRELTDDLADYGLGSAPGETPRARARRVARDAKLDEAATAAVSRIGAAEERARYARLPQPGAGLKADVLTARRGLAGSATRSQRLRARVLPASTLLAARRLLQRAIEMLGWLDSSWPAVRRQLRAVAHRPE